MAGERCCNKRMTLVEFTLQSKTRGFDYDVLFLFECLNRQCLKRTGWFYSTRKDETTSDPRWLKEDEVKKWVQRIDRDFTSRSDHKEFRAMVHVGQATLEMSRDTSQIYRKILKDVRTRANQTE